MNKNDSWRPKQKHHRIHKGMGGRHLKRDSYKANAPIPVRSESIEEVEESVVELTAREHSAEHGIKEAK